MESTLLVRDLTLDSISDSLLEFSFDKDDDDDDDNRLDKCNVICLCFIEFSLMLISTDDMASCRLAKVVSKFSDEVRKDRNSPVSSRWLLARCSNDVEPTIGHSTKLSLSGLFSSA